MFISYDYYRIFYYVAKYRSFTQAANLLFSNQPNVTRSIKNLEQELGCTLFIRSNRGVQLTPEGDKLYAHISVAFDHIQAGEEELSLDKSLQRGIVSVGASETALHCCLLPILKKYRQTYPGIRIRVSNHSTPQALTALKNGLVDLAVVTTPTGAEKTLTETPVKTFREVAVCGPALSFLAERTLSLSDLSQYPLISLETHTKTYEFYSRLFLREGITLSPDIEAATADQVLPMVKHDLGIGFVPEDFLADQKHPDTLFVLKLDTPIPERSVCLVKRSGQSLSIAAKELERMILCERKETTI